MLVECGLVRVTAGDGTGATFRPSLGRIAALGSPTRIVELFARLHGPAAADAAADVLSGLCDPDDLEALPLLIGGEKLDPADLSRAVETYPGAMPPEDRILIARHLMHHGICGKARPDARETAAQGRYSDRFDASEYVAAARVHLGLSSADAEALSMTELQQMLEMKFPDTKAARDVPSADEYAAGMKAFEELKARRAAGKADHG